MKYNVSSARLAALLLIALLVMPLLLTACGPAGPTNEEAIQAIQEYIKPTRIFSDYRGPYEVKIIEIGKPGTLGDPPNQLPAWLVKVSILRQILPLVPGAQKVYIVVQDPFGDWYVPALYQSLIDN